VETRIERVEVPVLTPEVGLDLPRAAEEASAAGDELTPVSSLILRALNGITSNPPPPKVSSAASMHAVPCIDQVPPSHRRPPPTSPAPRPQVPAPRPQRAEVTSELSGPQKRVMDAVATFRELDRPQKSGRRRHGALLADLEAATPIFWDS
jgi:hypothetical protein